MSAPSPLRRSSVLIVGDHPVVREGLSQLIASQPDLFVCAQAADCAAALTEARRTGPDAAIVDLSVASEAGLGLIRLLSQIDSPPRILALSMHQAPAYAKRAVRAGALGYVMKRDPSSAVLLALRAVIRGEFHVDGAIAIETLLWPTSGAARGAETLSDREIEVFHLIGQGRENREIATALDLSLKTIQSHCANIKRKLGLENGTLLIREAVRWSETDS